MMWVENLYHKGTILCPGNYKQFEMNKRGLGIGLHIVSRAAFLVLQKFVRCRQLLLISISLKKLQPK